LFYGIAELMLKNQIHARSTGNLHNVLEHLEKTRSLPMDFQMVGFSPAREMDA
jgi:hypothetical protein